MAQSPLHYTPDSCDGQAILISSIGVTGGAGDMIPGPQGPTGPTGAPGITRIDAALDYWVGTQAEWDAMSVGEQQSYSMADII